MSDRDDSPRKDAPQDDAPRDDAPTDDVQPPENTENLTEKPEVKIRPAARRGTRAQVLRGSARATTGLLIAATAAAAAIFVGNATLPVVETDTLAIAVDAEQHGTRQIVCAGSFAELGVDPDRPTVAIPSGTPSVRALGDAEETDELSRDEAGSGALPRSFSAASGSVIGAAQTQDVSSEAVRGRTASACVEPVNEQWIVGGSTAVGTSSTLSLGNPSDVPATVQVSVYTETGQVEASKTTGVLVPPVSERTVSLNGYAPDHDQLAVRVESTGATVTATMGVGETVDIRPFSADTVTRQVEPLEQLVIPAVTLVQDHEGHHAGEHGIRNENPVQVRLLAPGEDEGSATITTVDAKGKTTELGEVHLLPGEVQDFVVESWPEEANAVIVEATVPVVGGVRASAQKESVHDAGWFAPAPEIEADTQVAAPIVSGGRLFIANAGQEDATVSILADGADDDAKPTTVTVPAGAAVPVKAPANAIMTSDQPIHAGVRASAPTEMAGYPISPLADRSAELTVYPR